MRQKSKPTMPTSLSALDHFFPLVERNAWPAMAELSSSPLGHSTASAPEASGSGNGELWSSILSGVGASKAVVGRTVIVLGTSPSTSLLVPKQHLSVCLRCVRVSGCDFAFAASTNMANLSGQSPGARASRGSPGAALSFIRSKASLGTADAQ
jgi:hypothetical protein